MRSIRIHQSLVLALSVVVALLGAPAFADEGKDESGKQTEQNESTKNDESAKNEDEADKNDHESSRQDENEPSSDDTGEANEESTPDAADADEAEDRDVKSRREGAPARTATTAAASAASAQEGQGTVVIDPESDACPDGTELKIDNLRSDGTFGPITISNFTSTSFTWTSTQSVTTVLVKDGGGYSTNAGGTSGTASSLGQDISHVIFCLGAAVDVETPVEEPCDGDETMPGSQPCTPPCDADEDMPGVQECVKMPDVKVRPATPEDVSVRGERVARDTAVSPKRLAARASDVEGSVLPFTGGQLAGLATAALGLMLAGGGTLLIRRR